MALLLEAITPQTVQRSREMAHLAEDRRNLADHITPAALLLLGKAAGRCWLAPLWNELAQRAAALPFSPATAHLHAAALRLQAGHAGPGSKKTRTAAAWPGSRPGC